MKKFRKIFLVEVDSLEYLCTWRWASENQGLVSMNVMSKNFEGCNMSSSLLELFSCDKTEGNERDAFEETIENNNREQ